MTTDKIKHYIGQSIFNHIATLDKNNLLKMKHSIIQDMNLHTLGSEILFKRTIELQFINDRLK